MALDLKLYDECQLEATLHGNFSCEYSEDGRFFIVTNFGVYVFTLKCCLNSLFQQFSFKKDFFEVTDFSPSLNLGLDLEDFIYCLPREKFYEAILRLDLTAPLEPEADVAITPQPISARWSPKGIVGKVDSLLAVFTNYYSLELYVKHVDGIGKSSYVCIANITKEITNHFKPNWQQKTFSDPVEKYEELKIRVNITTPTAYGWSHLFKIENSTYMIIFVGHQNGSISAWRLQERSMNDASESEVKFVGIKTTDLKQITTVYWNQTSDYSGGLVFGDLNGRVGVINITNLDQDLIDFSVHAQLWDESDYKRINEIKVINYKDVTYIFVAKTNCIVIFAIDGEGVPLDKKTFSSSAYDITGMLHYRRNIMHILYLNGLFMELQVFCHNGEIHVETARIPLKIDLHKFYTHGLLTSQKNVFFGVVAAPSKFRFAVKTKKYINVFIFRNTKLNPFKIIYDNKESSLRDYWECYEILRLTCLKEKRFPWIGIDEFLNYDKLTLQQLKALRLLAKLSESMVSVVPVIREYNLKPYVIIHCLVEIKLAVKRIRYLLNLKQNGKELSVFQMRSIDLLNFFLKEMVVKNVLSKAQVGEDFVDDVYEVMAAANEIKYPLMQQCVWCGEKLIGSGCVPGHVDSRCAVSLMPTLFIPGYNCPMCKCVVHKEVEKEVGVLFCPYCDIPMESLYNNKDIESHIKENSGVQNVSIALSENPPEELTSSCHEDCLERTDNSSEEVEDNSIEYFAVSDDEDETEDKDNELMDLYMRAYVEPQKTS